MDRRALERFRKNRGAVIGLWLVVAILVFSFIVPLLVPHHPFTPDFDNGRGPFGTPGAPSRLHWLGTDTVFRDVLVRLAYGGRLSLEVAFVATLISLILGTAVGVVAGYFKGTRMRLDALAEGFGVLTLLIGLSARFAGAPTLWTRALALSGWFAVAAAVLRAWAMIDGALRRQAPTWMDAIDGLYGWALFNYFLIHRSRTFAQPNALITILVVAAILAAIRWSARTRNPYLRVDVDDAAMRLVDVLLAFPFLLLIMALSAAVDRTSEATIFLVLGLTAWTGAARVIRSKTLQVRELEFITASRALGQSTPSIVWRHVLPNIAGVAIVLATNSVAAMIVAEAALSFLGLSLPPPTASWGRMLDEGRSYYSMAPWLLFAPGAVILIAVLGFNLLGEGLRDAIDPRDAR
jgi:ABC-type dipeptide/oligopeptide/nickel transport system permease subunit